LLLPLGCLEAGEPATTVNGWRAVLLLLVLLLEEAPVVTRSATM
jgi:hypothetical protein